MKPAILIAVAHYKPGWKYGGPTRTVANLVDHLGDDFSFRILTSDRDFGDDKPFAAIASDRWQRIGKAEVLYLSPAKHRLLAIASILRETAYDVLYLNSFFHPVFTIKPLLAYRLGLAARRPCVLAPRGEFASAAQQIKAVKKAAFMRAAGVMGLYSGIRWQASSSFEGQDIARALPGIARDISIVGNLPPSASPSTDLAPLGEVSEARQGPLRVVLLSRLSRMKNVAFAIDVVASSPVPVQFDIWGTVEDEVYWRECQGRMKALPAHVHVNYKGPALHDCVPDILASYDLMFMPSLGENYGHVITEAFMAGTPVLISDRTPWRGLARAGIGWDLPIDAGYEAFRDAIAEALQRREKEGAAWRRRVCSYASRVLLKPELIDANRRLLADTGR